MHPAAIADEALLQECDLSVTRRTGPGGQHRNKVETAVVIRHRPSGVAAEASERRSRAENRGMAIRRLRLRLAIVIRTRPRGDSASPVWQSRCRGGRLAVSVEHRDYPTLVAEALDRVAAAGWHVAPAAEALRVTTSQLVGLFRKAPVVMVAVNAARRQRGLPPLG